jgi:hypothetical protein
LHVMDTFSKSRLVAVEKQVKISASYILCTCISLERTMSLIRFLWSQ